ncbi:hypothetical protein DRJ22_02405 [Candidatus Woesearchaeota archaeon]|nr:MAG: hypothetical protein B6U93_01620 [Candidatus Woesearchaeota archaeon ex4484_78]RLE46274.1 MAG: hypothetical protein DRJ22_02405 [Candidatus Woesearchaeota archaeon]
MKKKKIKLKLEEHHIVGIVVIIAVILLAGIGLYYTTQSNYGKAITIIDHKYIGYQCRCIKDNQIIQPFYSGEGFVILNGKEISIPTPENPEDPCPAVCASLGGFAEHK